jgi:hypothetical protein
MLAWRALQQILSAAPEKRVSTEEADAKSRSKAPF